MDICDVIKYQTIELPCPHCGQIQLKTIGWLNHNDQLHCGCGRTYTVSKENHLKEIHALEQRYQYIVD